MRTIATLPHPDMRISIFHMNDKYIVELETGPMKQVFKFFSEEVSGVEEIQKVLDEEFLRKAMDRFKEMFLELKRAKST
mgnify:CR=1 FL=1